MAREPPPAGVRFEGRDVEVTPHPVRKLAPKIPRMISMRSEVLLTAGFSSLNSAAKE
jgi:hypothetical protein